MKIFVQAIIASLIIHLLYYGGMTLIGYIQTKNYAPDIAGAWNNVQVLQTEVAIGHTYSPFLIFVTFIGVTVLCAIMMYVYKRIRHKRKSLREH